MIWALVVINCIILLTLVSFMILSFGAIEDAMEENKRLVRTVLQRNVGDKTARAYDVGLQPPPPEERPVG